MSAHIQISKHWLTSKTVWANGLAGLASAAALLAQELPEFKEKIPAGWYLATGALLAALNIWLRFGSPAPLRGAEPPPNPKEELGSPRQR